MAASLPAQMAPRDKMREGLSSLKSEHEPVHPVETIQRALDLSQHENKKAMLARLYGLHMPLKMEMEERILSQFRRGPGLQSSFAGLETLLGRDDTIDFGDVLADPRFSADEVRIPVEMDRRAGVKDDTEALRTLRNLK